MEDTHLWLQRSQRTGQSQRTHTLTLCAKQLLSRARGPLHFLSGHHTRSTWPSYLRGSTRSSWGVLPKLLFLHLCWGGSTEKLSRNPSFPQVLFPCLFPWPAPFCNPQCVIKASWPAFHHPTLTFCKCYCMLCLTTYLLSAIHFILVLQLKESNLTYCYKWFKFW